MHCRHNGERPLPELDAIPSLINRSRKKGGVEPTELTTCAGTKASLTERRTIPIAHTLDVAVRLGKPACRLWWLWWLWRLFRSCNRTPTE